MMVMNSDEVLADLKRIGAVGAPPPAPIPMPVPMPVVMEVEKRVSETLLDDSRQAEMFEAVDEAIDALDGVVRGLGELREALTRLREIGSLEMPPGPVDAADNTPEPPEPLEALEEPQRYDAEAFERAREAARRKILGEDLPPENRAALDEDDDVPFVGQGRALPPGMEPEEIIIGTVGKIKPSFPVEE